MRNTSINLMVAGFAALLLGACSAGGSFESNKAPVADAGVPLTVNVGQLVTLDGSGSNDPNGNLATYQWTQTAGTVVSLTGSATVNPTFTVPQLNVGDTLTFRLVVFDSEGLASAPDTVVVTVSNVTTIAVTGTVRFQRIPFRSAPTRLDYDNPVLQPARGVVVRAIAAGTTTVIAAGITSSTGTYSLTVPTSSTIVIQVEARLQRTTAPATWNIRVQSGANALAPYRFATAQFSAGAGTQDIDIPANMNPSGVPTGTRASAPFAILDTIYTAIQTLLVAVPDANLPSLYIDWGSDLGAFFNGQYIALRSDPTEDTDEFDQGVIAHEFGHFLEYIYSRSDSAGGEHGLGDRLDPSVAFSEGFATAFGAIALNNPIYLDSGVVNGNLVTGGFNVETNPVTSGPPMLPDDVGCWCSESSVWSLVWDLYDSVADANDNVALGFPPLWDALVNAAHSSTPALTSIFSYIASLKALPGQAPNAAVIDALVLAQNIDSANINAFANTETHAPFNNILPLYTTIVAGGGPLLLHTTDDGGTYNRAGNRRFLRWVPPEARSYRITVTTSNPDAQSDPDFVIYRNGLQVVESSSPPSPAGETLNFTPIAGITYVIDAYDCANGCPPPQQGIPGDYDLTVTITAN